MFAIMFAFASFAFGLVRKKEHMYSLLPVISWAYSLFIYGSFGDVNPSVLIDSHIRTDTYEISNSYSQAPIRILLLVVPVWEPMNAGTYSNHATWVV